MEVSDEHSKFVTDAISKLERLFTFDFSNNQLPQQMTRSIVSMLNGYAELQILCLDHCTMTDDVCEYILHNLKCE